MPESTRNPNRDLTYQQVIEQFAMRLPHLIEGLASDREWIWYAGPKPPEEDRTVLKYLGFGFTPRPHVTEDGRNAHWFHACGLPVLRRRKHSRRDNASEQQQEGDPVADLTRLAAEFQQLNK